MTGSPIKVFAALTAIGLALAAGPAGAQGQATGAPRSLAPGGPDQAATPPTDSTAQPDATGAASTAPSAPAAPGSDTAAGSGAGAPSGAAAGSDDTSPVPPDLAHRASIAVGQLGTLEGPVAGTLDVASGGLGPNLWAGTQRAGVMTILKRIPAATPSPTARLLLRKLLLTPAPPPSGPAEEPFNALRIRKLLEGGFVADAADLAAQVRSHDPTIQRAQADALLYAGRDEDACGDATSQRLESGDPFWVSLRAYCYAVAGNTDALNLTRAVMQAQGVGDAAFQQLLDGIAGGKASAPDSIPAPNALYVRMLAKLDLPFPSNVATLSLPASLLAAASDKTDKAVRIAAAERALRAGALSTGTLGAVLDLYQFKPADLDVADTMARSEDFMTALARVRAALKMKKDPADRAQLIDTAFEVGDAQGLLPQVAALFADDAAALTPSPDWSNWALTMTRGLLLAGKPDAAFTWYKALNPNTFGIRGTLDYLRVAIALTAPNRLAPGEADEALTEMAIQTLAPDVTGPTLARATLAIGLYEASGRMLPQQASDQIGQLLAISFPGRRPAPAAMKRINQASLNGQRGALALNVVDVMGPRGAIDLPPDLIVRLVRALRTGGMADSARSLSAEALLTHSTGL